MDIVRPIIKCFTYDFFTRRDGIDVRPYRATLHQSQYFSSDELAALQLRKLKELLAYCHHHNPYYRQRFDACGFQVGDLEDLSTLSQLPILTKDDIRETSDNLFSDDFTREHTAHKRTGGSTGVPLHNYWDWPAASFKRAGTQRHNAWAHLVPGVRTAAVWGDTDKPQPLRARVRNSLADRIFYLDTLKFDAEHIETFLREISRRRPEVLMGHAHSVYKLAEYVYENGVGRVAFDSIITTAMVLTATERTTIESVFDSPVFDRYGCEEIGMIASECDGHQGKHVFAEGLYVEVIGDSGNMPGELIVTDLVNYAMPMIRYQIGDYGTFATGDCPCGRGLPRLAEVSGRTADFLYTPDKMPVFGISILDTFVIHIPGLKQLQIVQDLYDHLDFYIVKGSDFSEDTMQLLKTNVIEIFGPNMRYDAHLVDRISQTEAGKFRFSICNINHGDKP